MANPNIVNSGLSRRITVEGRFYQVEIYRLEDDTVWTLEVVDDEGTSTVWDEPFQSDADAFTEVTSAVERDGAAAFREHANIIPFPRQ
jgi:uncharacterized protein